jgi:hypothetical protein
MGLAQVFQRVEEDFCLSDSVGCGRESLVAMVIRGASLGTAPKWTGPSYAEMVRSD